MDTKPPDFIRWTSQIKTEQRFTILPDGCQDIVFHKGRSATLTPLDMRPRQITLQPGDSITGYRLPPGLHIRQSDLEDLTTQADAAALIAQAGQSEISQALQTLGNDNLPVQTTANTLGVSLRTLQRQLGRFNLPPPEFWRLLGRVRRAATALSTDLSLADIAGIYGYSDQSHLTRACQHWFGATPGRIRQNAGLLADITQPALGTWGDSSRSSRQ